MKLNDVIVPSTIEGENVTLEDSKGRRVEIDCVGRRGPWQLEIRPRQPLRHRSEFRLKLKGGAGGLRGETGRSLTRVFSLSFTTCHRKRAPQVVECWPGENAVAVEPAAYIRIEFDRRLAPEH